MRFFGLSCLNDTSVSEFSASDLSGDSFIASSGDIMLVGVVRSGVSLQLVNNEYKTLSSPAEDDVVILCCSFNWL